MLSLLGLCWTAGAAAAPGDILRQWAAPGTSPSGLGWDGTHLWISNPPSSGALYNRISKHDPITGATISLFDHMPTSNNHHGLAFDTPTTMYTDRFYSQIVRLDTSGNQLQIFPAQGDAYGLAYDPVRSVLYQVNILTNVLHVLNPTTGASISNVALPFSTMMVAGSAWDGAGLWVVVTRNDTIYRIDVSTGAILTSFSAPARGPEGLAWDGACLWLSDTSRDEILRIDHGQASLPACTPMTSPDAGVAMPDSGPAPADAGFAPADAGFAPADAGFTPPDTGVVPAPDAGFPPVDSGVLPDTGTARPDAAPATDAGFAPPGDSGAHLDAAPAMDAGFAPRDTGVTPPRPDSGARPRRDASTEPDPETLHTSDCGCRMVAGARDAGHGYAAFFALIAVVFCRRRLAGRA